MDGSSEPFSDRKTKLFWCRSRCTYRHNFIQPACLNYKRFHKKTKEQNFILNSNLFEKTFDSLLSIRNGVSRRSFPKMSPPYASPFRSFTPFCPCLRRLDPHSLYLYICQPTFDVDIHSWLGMWICCCYALRVIWFYCSFVFVLLVFFQ